jgi:hypothetical protein
LFSPDYIKTLGHCVKKKAGAGFFTHKKQAGYQGTAPAGDNRPQPKKNGDISISFKRERDEQ